MTDKKSNVKRGRKPNTPTITSNAVDVISSPVLDEQPEEKQVEPVKIMGKRTPIHAQKVQGFKARPGYTARQIVEKAGRVQQFLDAGYVLAQGQERMENDGRLQATKGLGNACREVVNRHNLALGDSPTAVWVEIPTELYEQDQLEKLKAQQARESEIDPRSLEASNPNTYYGAKYTKSYE